MSWITARIDQVTENANKVVLAVGSAIIGKVGIDQTTDGTTNAVHLVAGTALAGKFGIDQTTPGTTNGVVVNGITAAKLQQSLQSRTSITCTLADTDYAAGAVIPAGTKYIEVYCAADFVLAVDTATTASVGKRIIANTQVVIPVSFGGGDSTLHAQSPTAGAVVYINYAKD